MKNGVGEMKFYRARDEVTLIGQWVNEVFMPYEDQHACSRPSETSSISPSSEHAT